MRTRFFIGLGLLGAVLSGCHGQAASSSDESRDICLADPDSGSSIDNAIRSAQVQARKLAIEPEPWVVTGRGWVRKARLTADPGFYVNVRACVDAALAAAPGNRPALQLRALALMNDHRFAEARDVASGVLRTDPTDPLTLGVLSDALLELGDFEAAAAAAQRMVDLQPNMASYSRAAYFRWLEGDGSKAKLFMRYALNGRDLQDREPTAWTFTQAASMYWSEGDYAGADAVFAEALKWIPDYAPALIGRARVLLSLGRAQEATTLLEKAYALNRLPETAWLLGDARAMAGDEAGSRAAYDQVVREGRRTDRLTLALFYATKNLESKEALQLIESERQGRGGVYVDDAYAWVLYRSGRIAEAQTASDRALRYGTRDARLLYHAGAIRIAAGNLPEGREMVQAALQLNPRFDVTASAEASSVLNHVTQVASR